MWGPSIVGFGSYPYKYESGREGDSCLMGFSSRKGDISIYGVAGIPGQEMHLSKLGKHKMGKGCLYIRKRARLILKCGLRRPPEGRRELCGDARASLKTEPQRPQRRIRSSLPSRSLWFIFEILDSLEFVVAADFWRTMRRSACA